MDNAIRADIDELPNHPEAGTAIARLAMVIQNTDGSGPDDEVQVELREIGTANVLWDIQSGGIIAMNRLLTSHDLRAFSVVITGPEAKIGKWRGKLAVEIQSRLEKLEE